MGNIQIYHSKLWFGCENQNWKLADFEMNEIKENLEGIQKYGSNRTKTKSIGMINFAMDYISNPIARIFDFSDNDSADLHSVPTKRMIQQEIIPV